MGWRRGRSLRALIEAVPSPRGGQWNASTINGNRRRRNGILNNGLYAGRIIYNRQRFLKDGGVTQATTPATPARLVDLVEKGLDVAIEHPVDAPPADAERECIQ